MNLGTAQLSLKSPLNAALALLAAVVMEFAMFMIWPQAGSLLMGLEKRVWNVEAPFVLFLGGNTQRYLP